MEFRDFLTSVVTIRQGKYLLATHRHTYIRTNVTKDRIQSASESHGTKPFAYSHIVKLDLLAKPEMWLSAIQRCGYDMYFISVYVGEVIGLDGQHPFNSSKKMKRMDTISDFHIPLL